MPQSRQKRRKFGGVHPKVVQERLGHAQISTTLDTYSHVLPGLEEDATRQLAARISRD